MLMTRAVLWVLAMATATTGVYTKFPNDLDHVDIIIAGGRVPSSHLQPKKTHVRQQAARRAVLLRRGSRKQTLLFPS